MVDALGREGFLSHLGWLVIDGLWQGLVIAVALAVALHLARRRASSLRHGLALTALLIWLAVPPTSYVASEVSRSWRPRTVELPSGPHPAGGESQEVPGGSADPGARAGYRGSAWFPAWPAEGLTRLAAPLAPRLEVLLPLVGLAWLVASVSLLVRLLVSLALAARLGRSGRALPGLRDRLGGRLILPERMSVRASTRVDAPTVIGGRRPVVLLPHGAYAALPDDQLELVLAHELAHLKRKDGTVNLLLAVAEAALPFHPFTWWSGAVIRLEREQACDDLALAVTGLPPVTLAQALAGLEAARAAPAGVLAATGNAGQLVRRVKRLLGQPVPGGSRGTVLPFLGAGLLALWLGSGAAQRPTLPPQPAAVVAIDAGHGDGTGAVGYVNEDPIVLQVALKLSELLEAEGVEVILTRTGANRLATSPVEDMTRRLEVAAAADVLVSLHAGAGGRAITRGIQTWIPGMDSDAVMTARLLASRKLAERTRSRLLEATGATDLGIRTSRFRLLDQASVLAVMFELGFVTNVEEGQLLASEGYQGTLAQALAAGILDYLASEARVDRARGSVPPGVRVAAVGLSYEKPGQFN